MGEHMRFDGKVVVITGGFPELGEATARLFAQRGAAGIVLGGRNVERGHAIAAIMTAAGCTSHFVPADLANLDDCAAVLGAADQAFGRIDVLINNLGVIDSSTLWETSPEIFDHIFAINVRAPFFFMQGAAAIMRRERIAGTLINIISLSCQKEPPLIPAYHASEGALASMMQSLGLALLDDGISVFGLNVGWPGAESDASAQVDFAPDGCGRTASGARTPQEAARAIALLASTQAGVDSGSIVDFNGGPADNWQASRSRPAMV
jgi:NAD(P)-dependent dehydrogenase (short-subunit alcohol dehydrogenase family)